MTMNCRSLSLLCTLIFVLVGSSCHATPTYRGREANAEWRRQANERIEKLRKADLTVEVVDGQGHPLPKAQVKVAMQRHAFAFGSAVAVRQLIEQGPDGERYRDTVARNFNKVVFENDMKWGPWETAKEYPNSVYRMENIDRSLAWLQQRGIAVRGHYAVWGHLEGDGGTQRRTILPVEEFRAAVLKHAEEVVRLVGPRVSEWDVVNHPLGWGKESMMDRFGSTFYDEVLADAAKWNPQAKRYVNEGGVLPHNGPNRDKYFSLLSGMRARGAKLQGIGFMGHFRGEHDLAPPEELLATFERFATLGVPLQVTEFDVRFGKEMEKLVTLTAEQEALQADYMRDFLTAAFSHPALEGVLLWGFWEGRDWYPDAALYRKDWSIKPNGRAWEDLVLRQWWTKTEAKTDGAGRLSTRGFLGEYLIEVSYPGKKGVSSKVRLERPGKTVRVVLQ